MEVKRTGQARDQSLCARACVCVRVCEREGREIEGRQQSERERLTLHIHSHTLTAHSNKWILTGSEGGGVKEEEGGSREEKEAGG